MTIHDVQTGHHDPLEELLSKLSHRVDEVALRIATESVSLNRHEEFITSRLAQAINDEIRRHPITAPGLTLQVHAEELTPMDEKPIGADLYVSLVRDDLDTRRSKGMLIQAKRAAALKKRSESRRLDEQALRMRRRAPNGSYIMIYGEDVIVYPAGTSPSFFPQENSLGKLIAKGLRCDAGEESIGHNLALDLGPGLRAKMQELRVPEALEFRVKDGY